ncbi:sensor histidine kinase [Streptomyces sp. NPDC047061]|uniref:sensor histidine kinase n=1 Tax=Streptomyces sp. NPDC047061 TaxID=3154605 RepID=UPI0033F5DCB7
MIDSLQRYARRRHLALDALLALGLFGCSLLTCLGALEGQDPPGAWWPTALVSVISCAALAWRRTRPRATAALTLAGALAMTALGHLVTVLLLGPLMVALFALAARTNRRTANTVAGIGIVLLTATALIAGASDEPLLVKLLSPAFWLLLPTSLGTLNRVHKAYLEAVQARAEHAERTRDEEARRRVTEERLRIARDLHDVVAHHLVLASMQASAVARFFRPQPDKAERVLAELTVATSAALRELRATVGVLRDPQDEEQPSDPAPGLAGLTDLTGSFRGAGLAVAVSVGGARLPLPTSTDLTAYRILQEALTNVTKHSAAREARVRLDYSPGLFRLTVTNDGVAHRPGSPDPHSGYGILGMRERARSVGGRLSAGPRPGGGFEVVADLPLAH